MQDSEEAVFKGKMAAQEFEDHATAGIPGQDAASLERLIDLRGIVFVERKDKYPNPPRS